MKKYISPDILILSITSRVTDNHYGSDETGHIGIGSMVIGPGNAQAPALKNLDGDLDDDSEEEEEDWE